MSLVADTAGHAIGIQFLKTGILRKGLDRPDTTRSGLEESFDIFISRRHDIVLFDRIAQRFTVNRRGIRIDQTCAVQFSHNAENAAGTVNVFNEIIMGCRRYLANTGNTTGNLIDVGHHERHFTFIGDCQQMQDRIGRPPHSHVQSHRIFERSLGDDTSRQNGIVVLFIITSGDFNDRSARFQKQFLAVGMRCQQGAVAGKRHAQRFCQTVHRVGREHARTGTAGRAGRSFVVRDLFIGNIRIASLNHGIDQIDLDHVLVALSVESTQNLARFHRTA